MAVLTVACGACRTLGVSVEQVALLTFDARFTGGKVTLRSQEALIVLFEEHEALAIGKSITRFSTFLHIMHIRLLSGIRASGDTTMFRVAVHVSIQLISENANGFAYAHILLWDGAGLVPSTA
jgi:hypothetical protein